MGGAGVKVAAKHQARVDRNAFTHAVSDTAHRTNSGNAKGKSDQENAELQERAAQFTPGDGKGKSK